MKIEFESKILDIDEKAVRLRLKELGAKLVGKYNFKRVVAELDSSKKNEKWLRLRTDGKKTTLTLKQRNGNEFSEDEVLVSGFNKTAKIIFSVFNNLKYVENDRDEYKLKDAIITLDKWPGIPIFLEIEAESREKVDKMYNLLKINGKLLGNQSVIAVYRYYKLDYKKFVSSDKSKNKLKEIFNNNF